MGYQLPGDGMIVMVRGVFMETYLAILGGKVDRFGCPNARFASLVVAGRVMVPPLHRHGYKGI